MAHLRLTNMNDKAVLFKIKTTAPKKYCVRPNCGSIQPNETLKVMIALQPFDYDPNEKNKHKFMVQSLVANEEGAEIEQAFYDANPEQVTEMKLRCVFEMPKDEPAAVAKDSSAGLLSSSPGKRAGGNGDDVVTTSGGAPTSTTGSGGGGFGSASSEQFRTTAEIGSNMSSSMRSDLVQEDMDQLRQENLLLNVSDGNYLVVIVVVKVVRATNSINFASWHYEESVRIPFLVQK